MKKKIVGIFVCMLMIATLAIPISALNNDVKLENKAISIVADVPTWQVGDSWTYNTHIYIAASENITDDMVVDVTGELIFEVVDDTGDIYKLEGLMKPMHGIIDLPGNIDLKISRMSSYKSTLEIHKSNLSLVKHELIMNGIVFLTLGPISLPLPIQMQNYRTTEFEPMWEIFPFPLFDGKTGDYENCLLIEEFRVSMFWGLIPINSGNISQANVGNGSYECNEDTITVEAGIYDVFNISCIVDYGPYVQDRFFSNYAEDVGNIAKGLYHLDYEATGNTYFLIKLELKSTTYKS
jgi:hypothetical protein